ncbi:MAG: hypothetical protein K2X98_02545 [Alphaproteobacteria bacterium]|nr:hypothetical protein [Alphaproteobacteria bacterium]
MGFLMMFLIMSSLSCVSMAGEGAETDVVSQEGKAEESGDIRDELSELATAAKKKIEEEKEGAKKRADEAGKINNPSIMRAPGLPGRKPKVLLGGDKYSADRGPPPPGKKEEKNKKEKD